MLHDEPVRIRKRLTGRYGGVSNLHNKHVLVPARRSCTKQRSQQHRWARDARLTIEATTEHNRVVYDRAGGGRSAHQYVLTSY